MDDDLSGLVGLLLLLGLAYLLIAATVAALIALVVVMARRLVRRWSGAFFRPVSRDDPPDDADDEAFRPMGAAGPHGFVAVSATAARAASEGVCWICGKDRDGGEHEH